MLIVDCRSKSITSAWKAFYSTIKNQQSTILNRDPVGNAKSGIPRLEPPSGELCDPACSTEPRRGSGLLLPTCPHALRKFLRCHMVSSSPAASALLQRVRVLPDLGRSRR